MIEGQPKTHQGSETKPYTQNRGLLSAMIGNGMMMGGIAEMALNKSHEGDMLGPILVVAGVILNAWIGIGLDVEVENRKVLENEILNLQNGKFQSTEISQISSPPYKS